MVSHYLLWATGADRPGIVAAVARVLYENGCNIEDSSMLRLGSEFAVLLIFSSKKPYSSSKANALFTKAARQYSLVVGVKPLTQKQARFQPAGKSVYMVSLQGADRPGLVFRTTALLAKHKFNITDLSTHRITKGTRPGYVLFVEGELPSARLNPLKRGLAALAKTLSTRIHIRPLAADSI